MSSNRHEEWNLNTLSGHSTTHIYDALSRNDCHHLYLPNQQQHSQQVLQLQSQNHQNANFPLNSLKRSRPSPPPPKIETLYQDLPPMKILPPPPPELNTSKKMRCDSEENTKRESLLSILPPLSHNVGEFNENRQVSMPSNPSMKNKNSARNDKDKTESRTNPSNSFSFDDYFTPYNAHAMINIDKEQAKFESYLGPLTNQLHVSLASMPNQSGLLNQRNTDFFQPRVQMKENAKLSRNMPSVRGQSSENVLQKLSAKDSWSLTKGKELETGEVEGGSSTQLLANDPSEKYESNGDEDVDIGTTSRTEICKTSFEKSFPLKIIGHGYDDYKINESLTSLLDNNAFDQKKGFLSEISPLAQSESSIPDARAHLEKDLKRKNSISPISLKSAKLPCITAISESLIIRPKSLDGEQSKFDCNPTLPDPKFIDHPCEVVIPDESVVKDVADADMMTKESRIDLYKKGRDLKKSLLLLKKKKLEITLRKQKDMEEKRLVENTCEITTPLTKEALKKRQEELQQAVDVAYWKRLVIQQRNLLEAEKLEVVQQNESIQSYQEEINSKLASIVGCETTLRELRVREKCLDECIAKAMQEVLSARRIRYEQRK
jgi:hypothetical protein